MTIDQDIDKLKAAALEAEKLEKLQQAYPDLKTYTGRWDKKVYCSPSVNAEVNKYERRFNCGCCGDSPLELWSYLETEYGRVYSDPPSFMVGEKDYVTDYRMYDGWQDKLLKADLSPNFVRSVELTLVGKHGRLYAKCLESAQYALGSDAAIEVHEFGDEESPDWWAIAGVKSEYACECKNGTKSSLDQRIVVQKMESSDTALRVLLAALEEYP